MKTTTQGDWRDRVIAEFRIFFLELLLIENIMIVIIILMFLFYLYGFAIVFAILLLHSYGLVIDSVSFSIFMDLLSTRSIFC